MALEQTIEDLKEQIVLLTVAVDTQTSLMKQMATGGSGKTTEKSSTDKKTTTKKTTTKKTSPADVGAAFSEFLKKPQDKDERRKIVAEVAKPILAHLGADKFSEIDADQVDEALGLLAKIDEAWDDGGADAVLEVDLGLSNEGDADDLNDLV